MLNATHKFFLILFAVSALTFQIQACSKAEPVKIIEPTKEEKKSEIKKEEINVKDFLKDDKVKDSDSTTK